MCSNKQSWLLFTCSICASSDCVPLLLFFFHFVSFLCFEYVCVDLLVEHLTVCMSIYIMHGRFEIVTRIRCVRHGTVIRVKNGHNNVHFFATKNNRTIVVVRKRTVCVCSWACTLSFDRNKYAETASAWESSERAVKEWRTEHWALDRLQNYFHRIAFLLGKHAPTNLTTNQPNNDNDSVDVCVCCMRWQKGERKKRSFVFFDFYTWSWLLVWLSPSTFFPKKLREKTTPTVVSKWLSFLLLFVCLSFGCFFEKVTNIFFSMGKINTTVG